MTKVKFLTIQFSNAASRSRRATRASFVLNVLPTLNRRAQGMPGARRARSRVRKVESTRVSHHGHAGNTRHSPRNGFNGCFALSPVTGLSCHRRQWSYLHQLDASVGASGPHDFAVRKISAFVNAPPASIASRANVRDDRETPLWVGRDGEGCESDLGQMGTRIFLQRGLDR
jgi:hypothetical protein